MQLSNEQIQHLYQFTRQHYVEYFDLQTELVDHLANSIEQQCTENPKRTFKEALQIEYKKFGVFGFMDVIEEHRAALKKKYNNLVWHLLKGFFSIPKIIGTLSCIGIVFYLLKFFQEGAQIMKGLFIALIVVFIIGLVLISRKNKRENLKTEKKWLLKEIIFGHSSLTGLINVPIQFAIQLHGKQYQDWTLALFSLLLVVFSITMYIVLVLIPSKSDEYLKETYPEYEMINNM